MKPKSYTPKNPIRESRKCPHCGHYHSNYKMVLTLLGMKYKCARCGKVM